MVWVLLSIALISVAIFSLKIFRPRQIATDSVSSPIPGPKAFPVFGSLPHIFWKLGKNPFRLSSFQLLNELRQHFGSEGVLSLTLGSNKFVILDELPLIKKLMASEDWSNRIKDDPIFKERTFGMDYGFLTSNGDSWREMRKFVAKTLVKFGFGRGTSLQLRHEEEIQEFFEYFEKTNPNITRNKSGSNDNFGAIVDMQGLFNIASLNILWTMVSSTRFGYDSIKVAQLTTILERMTRDIHPKEMGFLVFPWLRFVPKATAYGRFMQDGKEIQAYFRAVIDERRSLGCYKTEQNNFVDSFLFKIDQVNQKEMVDVTKKSGKSSFYTDEQLISVLVDLFVTGFLPISSCLEYLLMFMILHPEVQTKCWEEIKTVFASKSADQIHAISHTESLSYVTATITETLRKVSLIPLTSRAAVKDTWIDNYFVEKDTVALINLYHVHHNPQNWKDPDLFMPERFLNGDGTLGNQDIILPFGTGKRTCPAEVFARLTITTFFVNLIHRYEFLPDPENPCPDSTPLVGMGNYPKRFRALVKRRKMM